MYIKNGIAYAGEEKPMLKVNGEAKYLYAECFN